MEIQLTPEREAQLADLARRQGREPAELAGEFVTRVLEQQQESDAAKKSDAGERTIVDTFREIWADMPDEVRTRLPADGATEHDHYIYGSPKRHQR